MTAREPLLSFAARYATGRFTLEVDCELDARATGIFGPTGSGKTTLLLWMAGLLPGSTGRLQLRQRTLCDPATGTHLPPERRGIGFVFQDNRLFPHLNVRENIEFGRPRAGPSKPFDRIVAGLGLQDLLGARTRELSGGEAKRVAIARGLMREPSLLLLDEPFAALDDDTRAKATEFLDDWCRRRKLPVLIVSHDPRDLLALCDQVLVLANGRRVSLADCSTYFQSARD